MTQHAQRENDDTAKPCGYFLHDRSELLPHLPEGARRILDCGCGAGRFGRLLKEHGAEEVVGIEIDAAAAAQAAPLLDRVITGDLESMELSYPDGYFDCITCNDVLEHLRDPEAVLLKLKRVLAPGGAIVISVPNIQCYQTVLMLVEGRWKYEDAGIMDRTHLRFFTAYELAQLVARSGLELRSLRTLSLVNDPAIRRDDAGYLHFGRVRIGPLSDQEFIQYLTVQYVAVAVRPAA